MWILFIMSRICEKILACLLLEESCQCFFVDVLFSFDILYGMKYFSFCKFINIDIMHYTHICCSTKL